MICIRALKGVFVVFITTLLAACGGGGGSPSNVGDQDDLSPIAAATVIGAGFNNTVRSGGVVILSGKDSDGRDSPVLETQWTSADPTILLQERNAASVIFEAPNVAQPTDYTFTVTVFDAEEQSDSANITITVVPATDLNKFLTVDGPLVGRLTTTGATDFQKFNIIVTPLSGAEAITGTETFTLTVDAVLNYADRNATCGTALPGNPSQCLSWNNNAQLQLAVAGYPATVADVQWNEVGGFAAQTVVQTMIPTIDASEANQFLINSFPAGADESARDVLLDLWRGDTADITLTITLTSTIDADVMVSGPGSATIPLGPNDDVTISALLDDADASLAIETPETAAAYYAAIDPGNDFLTLNDWLVVRGFATRNPNNTVTLTQAALDGAGEFAHAVYTNNFDLGFGRDMFTRVDETTGNVYSFVTNYPTLQSSIERRDEFVTVVMEYSPPGGLDNDASPAPKFTKFFVYAVDEETGDQVRVRSIDFDGRGLKYVPGACTTCHGGTVPSKNEALSPSGYANSGDIDAMFFPWDLESFLYSDTDPAIPVSSNLNDVRTLEDIDPDRLFTRTAQEDQFRKLNMAALATYNQDQALEVLEEGDTSRFEAVIEYLGIVYPDPIPAQRPADCNGFACLAGDFADGAVPDGWATEPELYTEVHARHCRACHNQLTLPLLQFTTSESFLQNANIGDMVFRTGVMPMARLTMDRLWAGTDTAGAPIDLLRAALDDITDEVPGQPIPIAEFAEVNDGSVSGTTTDGNEFLLTKTGRTVDVTGENSLFFDSLSWSLANSSSDSDFPSCLQDFPALTDNGTSATLAPTMDADYCVTLTASATDAADRSAEPLLVRAVDDRATQIAASTCTGADDTSCVSVDEFTGGTPPTTALGAEILLDANAPPAITSLQTTLVALLDEDILDQLDSAADFRIEFTTTPSAGSQFLLNGTPTTATSFALQDLRNGNLLYESNYEDAEITVIPTIDTLSFDIFYTGGGIDSMVASGSAEVLIVVKGDNAPTLSIQRPTSTPIPFGSSVNGDFMITDNDIGEIILNFNLTTAPTGGLLTNVTAPSVIGASSGSFTYTADNGETLFNNGVYACTVGGGFVTQPNDSFTYTVTTGAAGDPASEFTDADTHTLDLTTSVNTGAISTLINTYVGDEGCTGCHGSTAFTIDIASARNLLNTTNPGRSSLLVIETGHLGGFPFDYTAEPAYADIRTWLFECAP